MATPETPVACDAARTYRTRAQILREILALFPSQLYSRKGVVAINGVDHVYMQHNHGAVWLYRPPHMAAAQGTWNLVARVWGDDFVRCSCKYPIGRIARRCDHIAALVEAKILEPYQVARTFDIVTTDVE